MVEKSKEVDAYVANAPAHAVAALKRIRKAFHEGAPDCRESIKWGAPHFDGRSIIGGMAAFKEHVAFGFWRGAELGADELLSQRIGNSDMRRMKVASAKELPTHAALVRLVRRAAALDAKGPARKEASQKKTAPVKRAAPKVPAELAAALARNAKARATFEAFAPSRRKEYVEWIAEAKRDETRSRRVAQAVEWMAEGKSRNWKYESGRRGAR
ncbi:MAG: YdeI/OmpD-associated family protein [Planctomycetota bacterium]